MEQNTPKFRLRLNLFDGIILALALAAGAVLLWMAARGSAPAAQSAVPSTVEYTVRFLAWPEGGGQLVKPGDKLVDNVKNFELGTVVSATPVPAETKVLDHKGRQYVQAKIEGYEDILVTVQSPCGESDKGIVLDGGFALRIGEVTYIKGQGYMASGPVVAIKREGLA